MIKILDYSKLKEDIFARGESSVNVEEVVKAIIEDVSKNGDQALYYYAEKFDKCQLDSLIVTNEEFEEAFSLVDSEFVEILRKASENIKLFHSKQLREGFEIKKENGVIIGQKITPIERVGLYVPGGTAVYPSTVLMDSIPAKIAGCSEICITTPPNSQGKINPNILVAASIAGVDKVYKVGGAQAIAALAYGTQTIAKVDKIVGPGNAFVAEAKRQVYGKVNIDMIAGPSEILIIADERSNARHIASDLLSQAEHDKMASAVLVTDSASLAEQVQIEIERQLETLPRRDIARVSIDVNGKIILAKDLSEVIEVSNRIAPEHLELMVDNPFEYLDKITNAGSVFLGRYCPESLGDYYAGPNHTLPTSGTARFSSPLSVDDFIKKTQYTYYTQEALAEVYEDVVYFAKKEGLDAHANSAKIRFED
ncbi:MAG: histidinol dehydrogenase [Clostridia bacterium]|nr:histidinol dehydrogenase [Clostridia bacterium]